MVQRKIAMQLSIDLWGQGSLMALCLNLVRYSLISQTEMKIYIYLSGLK